ncbi:MAG: hypothetical protein EPO01_01395 [Aquabacterium sp.]|nr:MAG: hypothetical protein EPO01_01395 [Aquabacterium sp.]
MSTTAWNEFDIHEAGRVLGHDFYIHSLLPRQDDWPAALRAGFDAAAHAGARRRRGDRHTGKWLQLRLGAWLRGRPVAGDVTPELLRQIDVERCPVTRERLTHGTQAGSDWSVDRLNNDAAYAASNLAVMSARANRAKGGLCFEEVHARSLRTDASGGLQPREWLRLAALMVGPAYATDPHGAPLLPLCAPLPVRALRLAPQQIQRLFTEHAGRPAGRNRLVREFSAACAGETAQRRLADLALAVHEGLRQLGEGELPCDVWLQQRPMQALLRWREALDARGWALAAAVSGRLSASRRETPQRLQSWALPSRGYAWGMRGGLALAGEHALR